MFHGFQSVDIDQPNKTQSALYAHLTMSSPDTSIAEDILAIMSETLSNSFYSLQLFLKILKLAIES